MTLDLSLILMALAAALPTAFVAYWAGVGAAERRAAAREEQLLADADYATALFMAGPGARVADVPTMRLVK